jgi:hypothetical protein
LPRGGAVFPGDAVSHLRRDCSTRLLTSDAGGVLLRETGRRVNLLPLAACFLNGRNPSMVR